MRMAPTGYITKLSAIIILMLLLGAGCASAPPVQEMSDARQAIQAARDAEARRHAPISFGEAERLLEQATRLIERKEYREAKKTALEAKRMALKARHASSAKRSSGDRTQY